MTINDFIVQTALLSCGDRLLAFGLSKAHSFALWDPPASSPYASPMGELLSWLAVTPQPDPMTYLEGDR